MSQSSYLIVVLFMILSLGRGSFLLLLTSGLPYHPILLLRPFFNLCNKISSIIFPHFVFLVGHWLVVRYHLLPPAVSLSHYSPAVFGWPEVDTCICQVFMRDLYSCSVIWLPLGPVFVPGDLEFVHWRAPIFFCSCTTGRRKNELLTLECGKLNHQSKWIF